MAGVMAREVRVPAKGPDISAYTVHVAVGGATPDEHWSRGIQLLRGTFGNYVNCWASFATAMVLACIGFVMMADSAEVRALPFYATLFLVAQCMTLAKVARDQQMASAGGETLEFEFLRPTNAYIVQVVAFFLAAVACVVHSLFTIQVSEQWRGTLVLAMLWIMTSSLCLAKTVRDQRDASLWDQLPPESRCNHVERIVAAAGGSLPYKVLVWTSVLVSLALSMVWLWLGPEYADLPVSSKGLISVCYPFCAVCAFHLAKLVRDRADPAKKKDLDRQLPYQFLIVAGFCVAGASLIAAVCTVEGATMPQRMFLATGGTYLTFSCLFLAKQVRDALESEDLLNSIRLGRGDPSLLEAGR
jgi:hypothetical protein